MVGLRVGVSLQPGWPVGDGRAVLRAAGVAEELGFDHVAVGNRVLASGFGVDADPLVLLGAVAGVTSRVRLLTSVLVVPYYRAVVLANQVATLDVVSGGRLVLGVGTGWNPEEFAAAGVPVRERGARTDDHLGAVRALWEDRPAAFAGRFTEFEGARAGVAPVTAGGPPVWVGGHSEAALRRVLRFGDGWYGTGVDAGQVREVRRRLGELAGSGPGGPDVERLAVAGAVFLTPPGVPVAVEAPGRPLGGAVASAGSVVAELGALAEAGLTDCTLWLPVAAEHLVPAMEWVAAEVVPQLG
ncbi:TIGR03619 family F420-dependent LLM class oxidoreductase [Kitasatospora saccharophila]|uniref:TIGR03619 family F420-dependent LLM class oxidoreductase n=1 Tax=Kitasatospora saccharophila TaxID=407973 RepID=UPI0036298751